MKRYLYDLGAQLCDGQIERRSPWISDQLLAAELAKNPNLDRLVDLPEEFLRDGVAHALPCE